MTLLLSMKCERKRKGSQGSENRVEVGQERNFIAINIFI